MNNNFKIELTIEIKYKDGIPSFLINPIKYAIDHGMVYLNNPDLILNSVGTISIIVPERQFTKLMEIEKTWIDKPLEKIELLIEDIQKLYRVLRWKYFFKGPENNIQEINIFWKIKKGNRIILSTTNFPANNF